MYQQVGSPHFISVNPRQAERLLLLNTYPGQRPVRPYLVDIYANKMREGLFRTGDIAIAKQLYNGGERVMANGQHTLNAVIVSGKTIQFKVEEYECSSAEDFSLLYQQFDTEGSRSLSDLIRVEAQANKLGWSMKVCSLVVHAATRYERVERVGKSQKVLLLREYEKFGLFLDNIFNKSIPKGVSKTKATRHMAKGPVVHAMLINWKKCQRDAETFWIQVRDGEGLNRTMPAYVLREFLSQHTLNHGHGAAGFRPVSAHEMTARCITAWNKFRQKKNMKIIKYFPSKPMPKAI